MKKWIIRIIVLLLILVTAAALYAIYQMRSRGFWRSPSYETEPPTLPALKSPAVLVFSKTQQFNHKEAIPAAESLIQNLGEKHGWSVYITENGAIHNDNDLAQFDVLFWNNVTGDVLNQEQQAAFKRYLENGGGWVGVHGSGDTSGTWQWYNEKIIGANFIGHPMNPQYQTATVYTENPSEVITQHLGGQWQHNDEWYSYDKSPRLTGATVLATIDESTYSPMFFKEDIAMGEDHPVIWKRCINQGRALYSSLGHTAEAYATPAYKTILEQSLHWAMTSDECSNSH